MDWPGLFLNLLPFLKRMDKEEHIITPEEAKAKRFELTRLVDVLSLSVEGSVQTSDVSYEIIKKGKKYFVSWAGLQLDRIGLMAGDAFVMTGYARWRK